MLTPGLRRPGATQIVTAAFTENDVLADPDSIIAKVMAPYGEVTTYTYGTDAELTKLAVGSYQLAFTPDNGGRWYIRWEATYTGSGVAVSEETMLVQVSPFTEGTLDAYRG